MKPFPITMSHLSLKEKLVFLRYRIAHFYSPLQRPKASWAQLLLAFGIRDTSEFKSRLVNADTIHDSLDAPIQRIKFSSLGVLALALGFTSVSINVANREFWARSPRGTISIIDIPTLGKALRFEGDILDFHALIRRCSPDWIYLACLLIVGRISFGLYTANGLYIPLDFIDKAISKKWSDDRFTNESMKAMVGNGKSFSVGPVHREARVLASITRMRGVADTGANTPTQDVSYIF